VAGANYGWPYSEGPDDLVAGLTFTAPLFTYPHSDPTPLGSGPGGFITGSAVVGGAFYPTSGPFPAGYRDQYYFADFSNKFVARLDSANGNAVYAFAQLSGSPVDLLVGIDGALYVLTRGGLTRISAP
jgi:glucose/arabinose dehydrogenase